MSNLKEQFILLAIRDGIIKLEDKDYFERSYEDSWWKMTKEKLKAMFDELKIHYN